MGALLDIASRVPTGWTLVGGQMVLLRALHDGLAPPRYSADMDMVVDVRLRPPVLPAFLACLRDEGFDPDMPSLDEVAHRFRRGGVVVDVLAPDGLGARADLRTVGTATTLEVGGGTFALSRTTPLEVGYGARVAMVPVPDLVGAILIKAVAARADRSPERHLLDLAFLLSLVPDPAWLSNELGVKNRRRVARVTALADAEHTAWRSIADARARRDGLDALRMLARDS